MLKKKKGFSLVELLAVIFVMGIISIIAIPTIDKAIKQSREELYKVQINNIITATKNWSSKNFILLPEEDGELITLTLGQLKIGGFIDENIQDPKTKKPFPNDLEITIKKVGNNYKYEVIDGSGGIDDSLDPNTPSIILNGLAHEIVEINDEYIDKGVIARDPSGALIDDVETVIKSNNIIVDEIDTSKLVQYKITYTVTYNGVSSSVIRTVTVKDTTPPILIIPEDIEITTQEVVDFDVTEGVIASDNSLKEPEIVISGSLNTLPGKYYIKYTAIDESGNSTTKTRIITVVESNSIIFNESKGVNHPQLVTGMTPIKWNGTTEVTTTENDSDWYDYSEKRWANAKTEDGSYWVWIPRYGYKITSCFHSNCSGGAGNIEIKFLIGTSNEASDG
ncbi:MAG: DUF5011 domain-containing protein, partial [Mollicutes bacterium]|nr:DUF5011 domain-containing protein [Mollicutes bacterium]